MQANKSIDIQITTPAGQQKILLLQEKYEKGLTNTLDCKWHDYLEKEIEIRTAQKLPCPLYENTDTATDDEATRANHITKRKELNRLELELKELENCLLNLRLQLCNHREACAMQNAAVEEEGKFVVYESPPMYPSGSPYSRDYYDPPQVAETDPNEMPPAKETENVSADKVISRSQSAKA